MLRRRLLLTRLLKAGSDVVCRRWLLLLMDGAAAKRGRIIEDFFIPWRRRLLCFLKEHDFYPKI